MFSSHHGNTPAAWAGVIIAFVGFCVAAVAVVLAKPVVMWVGIAVVLAGGVVGKVMQMAGYGKQIPTAAQAARSARVEAVQSAQSETTTSR